ncbi:MarR family winged helix-turn-helix transcriptional regulator [Pontibacter sp. G13]|uniref:MarR family winged helix-turn-helix transcriptional regulator n=1 Tax=Pontibacter sp. G13 TaxID=3074898 RepID=UPI002889F55E|nr:MarR family winged helix-turn-helix transcriptional regulator [Pontibacter sp. G13]WNJ18329.1 MarR family winged helix-turn-helix transcriptional regulator [Pontibacter sp. G13]
MELNERIIYGLSRLTDAYKALLWDKAKSLGISPIQIQLLMFVGTHTPEQCRVSQLAMEFNVTKPTISDAVKSLCQKELTEKVKGESDGRSFHLRLTTKGHEIVDSLADFSDPIRSALAEKSGADLAELYGHLTGLIWQLNRLGVIQVQRMCLGCRFYQKKGEAHHCRLLDSDLTVEDLRLDCPEFEKPLSA